MEIQKNISLLPYNSFHLESRANEFLSITSIDEIKSALEVYSVEPLLILGGGSNILFSKDVEGLVLKIDIKGIEEIKGDDLHVYVCAGAGENWHALVEYTMHRNWG